MTMNAWVKNNLGKAIDYDGTYGVQCVDLVKSFVKNVLGITPESIGNAIEYYNKRNTSPYLKNNFVWHDYKKGFVPQKGDICVFTSKSGNGHVSVATGEGNAKEFYSYDENYPNGKHEPMEKCKHSYTSLLGVLRPKEQKNIEAPQHAPTVKAGTTYVFTTNAICYKDSKKNGYYTIRELTDFSSDDKARRKKGTKVTPLTVKKEGKDIWITYHLPNSSKTLYALVYNSKKDKAYIK